MLNTSNNILERFLRFLTSHLAAIGMKNYQQLFCQRRTGCEMAMSRLDAQYIKYITTELHILHSNTNLQ